MRIATIRNRNREQAALVTARGLLPVSELNKLVSRHWPETLLELIESAELDNLLAWFSAEEGEIVTRAATMIIPLDQVQYAPLYRHPAKIWGIGLNYADHAADLSERPPDLFPASFIKPATTIIGHGETIKIPKLSKKTTGEAELGIVIGKRAKDVKREDWLDVVAGFTTIIDMTAEDILMKNPRYLTLCKSFDTFFSFGPQLVTPDEIEDVLDLRVATVINGAVHAQNVVRNMTFPPDFLVSFHSQVMTLLPGDIISSGTPRAVHLNHGDVVECRIDGFDPLVNPVIDLKEAPEDGVERD